jgi:aldehyde dehydrogenase (NAD+)
LSISTTYTTFCGGAPIGGDGRAIDLVDPTTGRTWATSVVNDAAIEAVVENSLAAFRSSAWSVFSQYERGALLRRLGDLIAANAEELGRLESLANGKTHKATTAEMRGTSQWYHFYASALETYDGIHRQVSRTAEAIIEREPLGVVVAITPFNGAVSLGSWKLAPALAMGNVVILKPPAEAPGSSIKLAQLAIEAGFPAGVVNVAVADVAASERLATHPDVAMVSFTGSTAVARTLGAKVAAGMKRFVCEAGGKSAHIVFEDADLDAAAIAATQGAFSATGQTCVAGSRVMVQASVYDAFLERYVASAERIRIGSPAENSTHLGPVANRRQYDRINDAVAAARSAGARIAHGGGKPTIVVDVDPSMPITRQELFGPVVTVQPFETEDEVIEMANGVEYGLAAGFWTKDVNRVRRVSRRLQAGSIWVNTYRAINMRVPFGGYKQSGIGRENGKEALDEFSQVKAVLIEHGQTFDPFAE